MNVLVFLGFFTLLSVPGNNFVESISVRADTSVQMSVVRFKPPWSSAFRADKNFPYQVVNSEGTHLFILNKTAWAYFAMKDPDSFLRKAKSQGITVIRVALEGVPYPDVLSYDMWPWGGTRKNPDYFTFNNEYWNRVEERIKLAGDEGIGIDLVLYFTLQKGTLRPDEQKHYWKQIIDRIGKYSNILTWEIVNEYTGQEDFQNLAGKFLKENDPYHHLICTSDGTTDNAVWPGKSWMDLAIVHTCTGSTEAYNLLWWYLSVARNVRQYSKPAFNNESGRETRHKNDDPVHRRKQGWLWSTAGCFWTYHSWEGCEGINDKTYNGPGQEYLKPMSDFFRSIPFWKMEPDYTIFQIHNPDIINCSLAETGCNSAIAYCCLPESGVATENQVACLRLPAGGYEISFLSPVTLEVIQKKELISTSLGKVLMVQMPAFTDDILVKIVKTEIGKRSVIEEAR